MLEWLLLNAQSDPRNSLYGRFAAFERSPLIARIGLPAATALCREHRARLGYVCFVGSTNVSSRSGSFSPS